MPTEPESRSYRDPNYVLIWFLAAAILVGAPLAGPTDASACSMCFSAIDRARDAYYLTTAFMIALPFALVGVIALWLWRAQRVQRSRRAPESA